MYPEKPAKKKGAFPKVTLRRRLTPGTVVILVAGRQHYKGIRMIFVKLLESGHLLLAGPHSLNRRPLMPVLQNFVIATSTKIPLTKEATLAAKKINFSMFKTVKKQKPKDSGIFTDSAAVVSYLVVIRGFKGIEKECTNYAKKLSESESGRIFTDRITAC